MLFSDLNNHSLFARKTYQISYLDWNSHFGSRRFLGFFSVFNKRPINRRSSIIENEFRRFNLLHQGSRLAEQARTAFFVYLQESMGLRLQFACQSLEIVLCEIF